MKRFKIDLRETYYNFPIGLYVREKTWYGGERWRQLDYFENVEKAKETYEQIKELPEYLD